MRELIIEVPDDFGKTLKKVPEKVNVEIKEEIVRCKDCWKRDFDNCPLNEFSLFQPDDDWFCADGERMRRRG